MDIRSFLKHCKALSTETYRHFTLPFDWEASARNTQLVYSIPSLIFWPRSCSVTWSFVTVNEIIVAIKQFIEYVANSWYCKLFYCLSGFVESKIP